MSYIAPDFSKLGLESVPDCIFEPAPKIAHCLMVYFYHNFPTYVKINGKWRLPENPRMDSHLLYDQTLIISRLKSFV